MKVLLFTGAGASVELGVPAMSVMASQFMQHAADWSIEHELLEQLMPEGEDLEDLIEKLDGVCSTRDSLRVIGVPADAVQRAVSLQSEVEWYVQHSCERVTAQAARQLWGAFLSASGQHDIVIATTNYDRAVELAANGMDYRVDDGFEPFGSLEIARWKDFDNMFGFAGSGTFTLLKLHGSTDWYELGSVEDPVKLRHPMPLFGGGTLTLPSIGQRLSAALILPSREKRVTRPPYLRLSQVFLNSAVEADVVVFVGSSFRDPHLRRAALDVARRTPTFVVDPASDLSRLPEAAVQIRETASEFLMSSLPVALRSDDPVANLQARVSARRDPLSVLPLVAVATDGSVARSERCRAIEVMAERGLGIGRAVLEPLLRDDDEVIARFALGMIPGSPDVHELLTLVASIVHHNPDYSEEVMLLHRLVSEVTGGVGAS